VAAWGRPARPGISRWFYNTWFHCSLLPAAAPKEDRPLLHSLYPSLVFSLDLMPRTTTPSDPFACSCSGHGGGSEEPVPRLRLALALLTFPNYFYHGLWPMEDLVLSLLLWTLVKPLRPRYIVQMHWHCAHDDVFFACLFGLSLCLAHQCACNCSRERELHPH